MQFTGHNYCNIYVLIIMANKPTQKKLRLEAAALIVKDVEY